MFHNEVGHGLLKLDFTLSINMCALVHQNTCLSRWEHNGYGLDHMSLWYINRRGYCPTHDEQQCHVTSCTCFSRWSVWWTWSEFLRSAALPFGAS